MGMDVSCLFPEKGIMLGYAVTATLDTMTADRIHDKSKMVEFFKAVEDAPKPVVVVMKDIGPRKSHACHFGEVMASVTRGLGAIGLVTDGGVRDLAAVRSLDFHLFAAGVVPAHGNYGLVEVNAPVVISETAVSPGDLVHGDENGVTVIPGNIVSELVREAQKVTDRERKIVHCARSKGFGLEELRRLLA